MTILLPVVLSSGWALAADCAPADVVKAFAQAADTRQTAALQELLHPEFRVVFAMAGGPDTSVISRFGWFALLNDGKIGGTPRTLTVHATGGAAAVSHVQATLSGASGRFESVFTVVRGAAGCQIVQDAVIFTPPLPR